jgi:hypothetical protein
MKKTFGLVIMAAIAILTSTVFTSCEKEALGEEEAPRESITTENFIHNSYQLGYSEVGILGGMSSFDKYLIPEIVEIPDGSHLVHSYTTKEVLYRYPIKSDLYGTYYKYEYYTVNHDFYAYYSIIVEWDSYNEVSTKGDIVKKREVQENLKCTVKYVGCTEDTPSEYIPTDTSPEITTYPDYQGEWFIVENSGGGSGGNGGNENDNSDREYEFHCATEYYMESLNETGDLYIYKSKRTGEYRASFAYSSKGVMLAATKVIYTDYTTIGGVTYAYKIIPFGIPYYFNFKK